MASAAILSLDELRDSRRCAAMQQRVQEHMAATGPGKGGIEMTTQAPARTRTEILISGFGGQGVVRMGQILGLCAINQGHWVTMPKSHGTETRGGYVRAQVVIAPDYVDSPVVENADIFVVFSAPAYKKFYDCCTGKILYDPEMVEEVRTDAPERRVAIAATALSKQHFDKPLFANMVMLGALTGVAGMDFDAMRKAMLEVIPRFHAENLRALELGYSDEESIESATREP